MTALRDVSVCYYCVLTRRRKKGGRGAGGGVCKLDVDRINANTLTTKSFVFRFDSCLRKHGLSVSCIRLSRSARIYLHQCKIYEITNFVFQ